MASAAAELVLPEPLSSRRRFDRAALSFGSACFVHDEARERLLGRLDGLKPGQGPCVDLGSALGEGAKALRNRFPERPILALDSSLQMLRLGGMAPAAVAGDATRLPFADASLGLLFANLILPWTRPDRLFAEARRVLAPDGVLLFSTLGPDTLSELRQAWAKADDAIHVHGLFDLQTLGDLAVRAGLEEPVLDVDRLRISYSELSAAIRDLRAVGATNTAGGRRRGLTGRRRWQKFVEALWREQGAGSSGRLHLTVELIFGQAFGTRSQSTENADGSVRVPVSVLKGAAARR